MKKLTLLIVTLLILSCSSNNKTIQKEILKSQYDNLTINMLKNEIRENKNNPNPYLRLGMAYAQIDSINLAIQYIDTSLSLKPSMPEALMEKGTLLVKKNQIREGYELYLNALQTENGEDYSSEIATRIGRPHPIHQLTKGNYNNAYGYFSPDGKRIVFQSDRDENWEIYIMDIEGTNDVRLTNNPAYDEMPVFSPEGKMILFTSTRDDTSHKDRISMNRNIYVMDISGARASKVIGTDYDDWYPSIADKSKDIVFVSEMDDPRDVKFDQRWSDIYIKNIKTGKQLRLTQNEADDGAPSFSRNSKWIVFNSNRNGGLFQIFRMSKAGNLVQQITELPGNCAAPHFSHNERFITFFAEIDKNYDIYIMNATGEKIKKLTNNPAQDAYPCFSPDGNKILFHSNRNGHYQLYWIDLMTNLQHEEVIKQLEERIASLN